MKINKITIGFCLLVLLSGCIGEYYGYSQQEWSNLSQAEKQKAKANYEKLVAQKNKINEGEKIDKATEEFIDRNIGKH